MVIFRLWRRSREIWTKVPKDLRRWVLALSTLVLAVGAVSAFWLWGRPEPSDVYQQLRAHTRGRVELRAPADSAWARALANGRRRLGEGGSSEVIADWIAFAVPPPPPFLCRYQETEGVSNSETEQLARTLHRLEAGELGEDPIDGENQAAQVLERYIERGLDSVATASFSHLYNVANAALRLGRLPIAVEYVNALRPQIDSLSLPSRNVRGAAQYARQRGLTDADIAQVFLGRYLAALIQLERDGLGEEAIHFFRYAINAFNYLSRVDGSHAREIPMPVYRSWACARSQIREGLTSLDAYSGLIAAYVRTEGYSHPSNEALLQEVRRDRVDMEPDDPLRPLLLYAESVASRPSTSAIPENILWAVSNVQRVHHLNRVRPTPRLEVARAALALHVVSHPDWTDLLAARQDMSECAFLRDILQGLEAVGRRLWSRDPGALSHEEAGLAAVSLYVAAAADARCEEPPEIIPEARTGLLVAGVPELLDPVPGIYEARRLRLQRATVADAVVTLDSIEAERKDLEGGRVPPYFRGAHADRTLAFVQAWQRALFLDLAQGLAEMANNEYAAMRAEGTGDGVLGSLEAATLLAGVRPSSVYSVDRMGALAPGWTHRLRFTVRSALREHPIISSVGLVSGVLVLLVLLGWTVLSVWLWRLVQGKAYVREKLARSPHLRVRNIQAPDAQDEGNGWPSTYPRDV